VFTEPFPSNKARGDIQTHRQQGEPENFLLLIQNKESRLKTENRERGKKRKRNMEVRNGGAGEKKVKTEKEEMYYGVNVLKLVTSCNIK
jgi:hypothetical protein